MPPPLTGPSRARFCTPLLSIYLVVVRLRLKQCLPVAPFTDPIMNSNQDGVGASAPASVRTPHIVSPRWPSRTDGAAAPPPAVQAPSVEGNDSGSETGSSVGSAGDRPLLPVWTKEAEKTETSGAPAAAGTSGPRKPWEEYLQRDDIGSFGVYQGNWSGWRKEKEVRAHIFQDIVLRCPGNVLMAQEVDLEFIDLLRDPAKHAGGQARWVPKSQAAAEAAKAQQLRDAPPWRVVHGDEGNGGWKGTCIIAARACVATEVQLVEWRKIPDGKYTGSPGKWENAYSRILVARIIWRRPMNGQAATVVATVHMHRNTAKRAKSFARANDAFWNHLRAVLSAHAPVVLTGDFNMSLFQVVPKLRQWNYPAELISWFAWVQSDHVALPTVQEADEEDGAAPAAAGSAVAAPAAPLPVGQVMLESCGIFSLQPLTQLHTVLNVEDLQGSDKLGRFIKGQGYPAKSYQGEEEAARKSLSRLPAQKVAPGGPGHDHTLRAKQKLVDPAKWDATQMLFRSGGHMPLLAYFGHLSGRSPQALEKRERKSTMRNWGPQPGGNRSKLMQQQGKGPPPSQRRAAERASAAAESTPDESAAQAPNTQSQGWSSGSWSSKSWQQRP